MSRIIDEVYTAAETIGQSCDRLCSTLGSLDASDADLQAEVILRRAEFLEEQWVFFRSAVANLRRATSGR